MMMKNNAPFVTKHDDPSNFADMLSTQHHCKCVDLFVFACFVQYDDDAFAFTAM